MNSWENLSEEKKEQFIAIIQENSDVVAYLFEALTPLMEVLQPIFELFAAAADKVWGVITEHLTEEEIEYMINKFGS